MAAGQVAAHRGVTIKLDGTPVALAAEPMSLVSGKVYRVTSVAKRCFDPNTALEIRANGVAVAPANIEAIDYLHGLVIFAAAFTPTLPITAHAGAYVPFLTLGTVNSFDVKMTGEALDSSVFGLAHKRYKRGLGDFSGTLGLISFLEESVGVATLEATLNTAIPRIVSVEIIQDGATLANGGLIWRGNTLLSTADTDAEPAGLVETSITLEGSAITSAVGVSSLGWPVMWSILDGATGLRI